MIRFFVIICCLFLFFIDFSFAQTDQTITSNSESRNATKDFQISCNPNPTYDSTTFVYTIKKAGLVSLKIYNDLGHKIDEPINTYKDVGLFEVSWNPNKNRHKGGVYYARVGVGEEYQLLRIRFIQ
jgi:hypothetical protein